MSKTAMHTVTMPTLDCGDNSCLFAPRKGGMRTNGGCRCLSDLPSAFRRDLTRLILGQRARVAELESGIRAIIAYEWGKPGDGYEVAPSGLATPSDQVAWRALESLVGSHSVSKSEEPK